MTEGTAQEGRVAVRPAQPDDAPMIFALVREFAAFERLTVDATEAGLAAALFGQAPRVFCEIADWTDATGGAEPAGCAVWFYNFSTFRGRHGIFLEDLFVRPAFRRRRIGTALLAHLARRCVAERLARFDWIVLGWNRTAVDFYRRHGAEFLDDWRICRVSGDALEALAKA